MSREIHAVSKWGKSEEPRLGEVNETRYWVVRPLSYENTIKLQASELIEHYTRDSVKGEVRFWPPTVGVYNYLKEMSPVGVTITNDRDTCGWVKLSDARHSRA